MKFSGKIFIVWLGLSIIFMQTLNVSAVANTGITTREPQVLSSPEENIPVVASTPSEGKGAGKWLWTILGVALLGGDDDDDDATGSIVISGPAP